MKLSVNMRAPGDCLCSSWSSSVGVEELFHPDKHEEVMVLQMHPAESDESEGCVCCLKSSPDFVVQWFEKELKTCFDLHENLPKWGEKSVCAV